MRIYDQPSLTRIPGYFTIQAHPDHAVIPVIAKTNALFPRLQQQIEQRFQAPPPLAKERCHSAMVTAARNHLSNAISPLTPLSIFGYVIALHYAEQHLLSLKISELTPNALLKIVHRINLCMSISEFPGGMYRESDSVVYTDRMPAGRDRKAFQQVEEYILSIANDEQKVLWETTSLKVWDTFFADSPCEFDREEKELLHGIMEFKPEYQEIPAMMQEFTEEFCRKVAANEELDPLCSWVHQKLVEIHPYNDGNGRTARFLMNLTRMWVGEKPLLFDNLNNYSQAVRTLNPETFLNYLKALKPQQVDLDPFLDQCLQSMYKENIVTWNCDQLVQQILAAPV